MGWGRGLSHIMDYHKHCYEYSLRAEPHIKAALPISGRGQEGALGSQSSMHAKVSGAGPSRAKSGRDPIMKSAINRNTIEALAEVPQNFQLRQRSPPAARCLQLLMIAYRLYILFLSTLLTADRPTTTTTTIAVTTAAAATTTNVGWSNLHCAAADCMQSSGSTWAEHLQFVCAPASEIFAVACTLISTAILFQ